MAGSYTAFVSKGDLQRGPAFLPVCGGTSQAQWGFAERPPAREVRRRAVAFRHRQARQNPETAPHVYPGAALPNHLNARVRVRSSGDQGTRRGQKGLSATLDKQGPVKALSRIQAAAEVAHGDCD